MRKPSPPARKRRLRGRAGRPRTTSDDFCNAACEMERTTGRKDRRFRSTLPVAEIFHNLRAPERGDRHHAWNSIPTMSAGGRQRVRLDRRPHFAPVCRTVRGS